MIDGMYMKNWTDVDAFRELRKINLENNISFSIEIFPEILLLSNCVSTSLETSVRL